MDMPLEMCLLLQEELENYSTAAWTMRQSKILGPFVLD